MSGAGASELVSFGDMVATSERMRRLFERLRRMARDDSSVLLVGESGTGKELAARGLHALSHRRKGPFVALNCAALSESLFESELFGHEKGAFTGAASRSDGAFHQANGGTLFLDEIGEIRLDLQTKLLRVLESGEVRRIGGHVRESPNVRVVAATNRDLREMVRAGTFRSDLFWRLAVLALELPPLRERPEDVKVVANALLERRHRGVRLSTGAAAALALHDWPGNVRELRNVLTRAVVFGGTTTIEEPDLCFDPLSSETVARPRPVSSEGRARIGRAEIVAALEQAGGNKSKAADLLGIPRTTLLDRMSRLGLS